MLDALTGSLEGGAPLVSRTIGSWAASEIADLLRAQEKAHELPDRQLSFFREGRTGANFVIRATDQVRLDSCATDLAAALEEAGFRDRRGRHLENRCFSTRRKPERPNSDARLISGRPSARSCPIRAHDARLRAHLAG